MLQDLGGAYIEGYKTLNKTVQYLDNVPRMLFILRIYILITNIMAYNYDVYIFCHNSIKRFLFMTGEPYMHYLAYTIG